MTWAKIGPNELETAKNKSFGIPGGPATTLVNMFFGHVNSGHALATAILRQKMGPKKDKIFFN